MKKIHTPKLTFFTLEQVHKSFGTGYNRILEGWLNDWPRAMTWRDKSWTSSFKLWRDRENVREEHF